MPTAKPAVRRDEPIEALLKEGRKFPPPKGFAKQAVVKSAAIYGANASGKSNLVRALHFVKSMVLASFTDVKPDVELDISPFRLRTDTATQPSEFSVIWLDGDVRFRYQF